ncbi:MAG: FAD-dependent oxidoreductase, partial [Gammaproteobacteria bacterium]
MLKRAFLLAGLVLLVGLFFAFDLDRYLSLAYLQSQRAAIVDYRDAHPLATSLGFFAVYVAVTALSLPGAAVMTLAAGAIFGLVWGLVIVSFASSIGATLAMLVARFVARDAIQARYGDRLQAINAGIERDGAFYLFALRLVPLFPFFVINLLMGLTRMRVWTFYWVSQLGMLAGTIVYVNAGTQLAQLSSPRGILSLDLIGAFVLLGIFPLIARKLVDGIRARRVYAPYRRPRRYDRNLIVIGAGSAGLVTAYIAALVKAKVTLIEKHKMGGDCLNTGCVPSKALIRSAKLASHLGRAGEFGFDDVSGKPDFAKVMQRVQRIVETIEPHDSVERYTGLGVECIQGEARLVDPWTVEVNGRRLTARDIVIAAGAEPFVPPIPGLAEAGYLTSDTLWELRELPRRLVVLGGGPIGCELTQAFARLGSQVTQVEMLPRLMTREDPEIAAAVKARFEAEGIDVRVGTKATAVEIADGEKILVCEAEGGVQRIPFDC